MELIKCSLCAVDCKFGYTPSSTTPSTPFIPALITQGINKPRNLITQNKAAAKPGTETEIETETEPKATQKGKAEAEA